MGCCAWPRRAWGGFIALRRSPLTSLFVVCVAIFTDMLVYGMVVPIFVPEILNVTTIEVGVLFAMYAAGLLIATPVFGILTDRFGRKWPMLCGLVGLGAATSILAFINFFPLMAVARCFQGISAAATWVTGLALVADTFPTEKLGWAMGVVMSVCQVGILIGPTFGGFVYELAGYQMPFLIAAGVAVFDGVLRILLVSDDMPSWKTTEQQNKKQADDKSTATKTPQSPIATRKSGRLNLDESESLSDDDDIESGEDASPRSQPDGAPSSNGVAASVTTPLLGAKDSSTAHGDATVSAHTADAKLAQAPLSFWDLVQNKSILITSIVVLLAANALTVLEPTLPAHLDRVFDSTPMLTGLVFMCESLVDIVASPLVGWYSDRVGNKPLMIAGMLLAGLVMPIVALPTEWWQQYLAVSAMAICNALMLTPTLPELAIQVDAMGGGAYGQVYAIYNFFYSLGMLGGPLVGSILTDHIGLFLTMVIFGGVVALFSPVLVAAQVFGFGSPSTSTKRRPSLHDEAEHKADPAAHADDTTLARAADIVESEQPAAVSSPVPEHERQGLLSAV